MTQKELSEDSQKIAIFLSTEFLLVALISIPLFLFKPANGGNLVMVMSIIFMWLPALATSITRKVTNDKNELLLKPQIEKNWKIILNTLKKILK